MGGFETRLDRELLGRVASLNRGQQRWLRTVLQSIFSMEEPSRPKAARRDEGQARRGRATPPREAERAPRRQGVDDLLKGERSAEQEYPELADDLQGIADIAGLLRESGQGRRRLGEELMRLFEAGEEQAAEDEEEDDEPEGGTHLN